MPLLSSLRRFFAVDDPWERPGRALTRGDVIGTAVVAVLSLATLELMRGVGSLRHVEEPLWQQWLLTAGPCLLLLGRRRWPLGILVGGSVAFWAIATCSPLMASLLTTQVVYFTLVFSGVAWARRRSEMVLVVGAVLLAMAAWLVWGFAVGNVVDEYMGIDDAQATTGALPPVVSGVLLTSLINVVFFGGAVGGGQVSWRNARQRAHLAEQARTIRTQADELQRQAVVDERLRIARELHDVVAHHVSVIGVQAGAARKVLDRDPDAARQALSTIEGSSRDAVTQMRGLLGTLRTDLAGGEGEGGGAGERAAAADRGPEPGLEDIADLVAERSSASLSVVHELVTDGPDALDRVPGALGHSLYRTAQESLTNVAKHSTARSARVVVRVEASGPAPFAEVEVTDDGRPRPGTSGSGLGHMGVRERAASLSGTVDIGPRALGGYRVRLRAPLTPMKDPA